MKTKIAIVTVPYVTNNELYELMVNSIESIRSDKYELIHIAIINKCENPWRDFVNNYADFIIENDENCLARAWNLGTKKALELDIKYIVIPNLDVRANFKTVDNLINCLESGYDFVGGYTEGVVMANRSGLVEKFEGNPFSFFAMTKECYEKVGAFDENFKPAYFEDNDYAYRMRLLNIKFCTNYEAPFIHYGSQTIAKDFDLGQLNNITFHKNAEYFRKKWGGMPDEEVYTSEFNK